MKNWIIAILVCLVGVLVLNTVFGWFTPSQSDKIVKEFIKGKTDTLVVEKYITKDSIVHAKFEPNKGYIIDNHISQKYLTYVKDTLAPALKIANERINELTRVNANLSGKLKATRIELTEEHFRKIYFENKYLTIVANEKDSTINYNYNATIDVVNYTEKGNLFKKGKTYVDISSPDKNFKINGVENFKKEIEVKPNKWGVGVQAGYHYNPETNTFSPSIGVGLSYNFIRF